MIAQKGRPALRRRSPPPRHVLGYTRLPDIDAELEQFAVDPRCTPQRVGKAHVADQLAYLRRHLWPSPAGSRFPAPICSEPCPVPTDHGIRLDDRQRAPNIGEQPIETDQYQSVGATEEKPFWRGPPQHIDLLAQHQVLRLERPPRSEQPDKRPPGQSAKVPHRTTASPDSHPLASRTRFPIGTAGDKLPDRDRRSAGRVRYRSERHAASGRDVRSSMAPGGGPALEAPGLIGRHDAERRGVGDAFYIAAAPNERLDLLVERRDWW